MSGSLCNKDQLLWSWRSNISCKTVSSFVKCAWYNNYSQFVVKMIKRPCKLVQFRSVTHSCWTLCDPMNFRTPGFPVHHHLPELAQTHPLSLWCHPTISSSVVPFSSCPQSFPASGPFQMNQFFASGGQSIGVSASTSLLPMNTQDWSTLDGLVGSPCSPRDSQESSPTQQFKSIDSSAFSFLHSRTLTSIHDYWKNHSLD